MPDDPIVAEPEPTDPKTEPPKDSDFVSRKEFDELAARATALTQGMAEAAQRLAVIDKVAAMLQGKSPESLTKEEQMVVDELKRLMPHILPNAKALDEMSGIKTVVDQAHKATTDALVQGAFTYQLELQKAAGLPIDNAEQNFFLGTAIKEWLNQDETRRTRFWRGDREIIREGFEKVKAVLIDPHRPAPGSPTGIVKHRPKSAAPGGAPGTGEAPAGIDFSNRKTVRDALRAALG